MRALSIHKLLAAFGAALAVTAAAQLPAHIGRYESDPNDTAAILQVTKDFQVALIGKDAKKLSALLLNARVLFSSPASPARVRKQRDEGKTGFDGVDPDGASAFLEFVATSAQPVEEKFHNLRITQDGHLAWVMFDFEFLQAGKVENHGLEVWQLIKAGDGSWKILSVVWSSHGSPK